MPAAPLPPMTSRQAKRLHKKSKTAQIQYTASQMRAADRRDELEKRRRKAEEKERAKKTNKRKREEKEEKQRAVKLRLIDEGKISAEEAWGKVAASQPRLHNFFNHTTATVPHPSSSQTPAMETDGFFAPEDASLVDPITLNQQPQELDLEYLPGIRSFPQFSGQHSISVSVSSKEDTTDMANPKDSTALSEQNGIHVQDSAHRFDPDFVIAEDRSAGILYQRPSEEISALGNANGILSPSNPVRSALSEMSPAKVNVRAQEMPDTTSAPRIESGLPSPCRSVQRSSQIIADTLAMISTQDLEDDEFLLDKENSDPLRSPPKQRTQKNVYSPALYKNLNGDRKPTPSPGFGDFSDCEDLFEFDFSDEDDFDEGVDDATLLTMAATQRPRNSVIINPEGSPKRIPLPRSSFRKPPIVELTPQKSMPPPRRLELPTQDNSNRSLTRTSTPSKRKLNSESFGSVDDEDLVEFAEHVEAKHDHSAASATVTSARSTFTKRLSTNPTPTKRKRVLPWHINPLPPPSTQDIMLDLVDLLEAEDN